MDYCGFGDWPACTGPFNLANTGGGTDLALILIGVGVLCLIIGGIVTMVKRRG